jgi:hypothetical protein
MVGSRGHCALIAAALTIALGARAADETPLYLMSGFTDVHGTNNPRSEEKLRFWVSRDAQTWSPLTPDWVYEDPHAATGGNIRDPSIVWHGGAWWVAYTNDQVNGVTTPRWSLARSVDLTHWAWVADISTAAVPGALNNWAPEFFTDADGSLHVFVSIATRPGADNFQIYETHPTDPTGLTQWSTPVMISGPGIPADAIDPFVLSAGGAYCLFWKDDANLNLGVSSSASLTAGYQSVNPNITANGANCEGPSVIPLSPGVWRLICDQRVDRGLRSADASDGFAAWTPLAPALGDPPAVWNHGTAIRLTDAAARATVEAVISGAKPAP